MIDDLLTKEEKRLTKTSFFKEGETLFYENDICDQIGIVIEGEVKISSFTIEGNEVIYNSLTNGMMFGNNLIFSTDNKFRGNVKAVTDSKVCLISKTNLIKLLRNNEEFLLTYLSMNSDFTKTLNMKIKLLSFINAKERLLYYFHVNNNRIVYKNITTLAKELYLAREVTSRLISKLSKDKKINKKKHELILLDVSF